MTTVSVLLALLALVDGACSGFRASLGRTGLVRHGPAGRRAAGQGMVLAATLLLPAATLTGLGLAAGSFTASDISMAGRRMLTVVAPYALIVGAALLGYAVLRWRQKYLAMALVLGPFTLVRPAVAGVAGVVGCTASPSWMLSSAVVLGVVAVLAVEPLMNRRWRSQATRIPEPAVVCPTTGYPGTSPTTSSPPEV